MFAASTSLFTLKFLSGDQIAFLVLEQASTIWTRCQAPSTAGTSLPKGQTPVEPHSHPHAAENKELLTSVVCITQLITQLQQLDQGIRSVEHPDASVRDGFEDLAPPLVDQVRRRDDHRPAITSSMHDCSESDGHHCFAGTHLGIDDASLLILIEQKRSNCLDHLSLGREGLSFEALQHPLPSRIVDAGIDRWIGAVE
ncbi:hypothetical protein ALP03_200299 [Pseudomonas amygdali pv. tabaci]|uniref:Uncharacterized protein n=1 Tax=Pseudomonas amygdali pv. tabaci TaxID=322 RepID=A0A3M6GZV2_PSEAJ|nr:hypothetical protein ALP03_200299 [Pseudomonas amygdali pv. tabaci]